jgi:3-dehydroquinate synthase
VVLADTDTLNTLDDRELSAGLAEVIKYGLINDVEFLGWLEENIAALMRREPAALAYAIERSCVDKSVIVAADEREAGQRALLNLGHTFGHAIENGMGYGAWLHGEAVGCGMAMAARLSARLGWITEHDVARVIRLLQQARLPVAPPASMSAGQFMDIMAVDKKNLGSRLRLVLMKGLGNSFITEEFDQQVLVDMLNEMLPGC